MLKFENVSTFYGKIQALHSVNVEINQGEIDMIVEIGVRGLQVGRDAGDSVPEIREH